MDLWNMAFDALPREKELDTVDQRIAHANVLALLAIGQHLSRINEGESRFAEAIVDVARTLDPNAGSTDWRR